VQNYLRRTDLEIHAGAHLLIMAKRGLLLPGELRLTQYAPRSPHAQPSIADRGRAGEPRSRPRRPH